MVNTFYYADKYNLKVSKRLLKLIQEFHFGHNYDYESIQIKHFGKILYDDKEISNRLSNASKINPNEENKEKMVGRKGKL